MAHIGVPHRKQFVIGRCSALNRHSWPQRFLTLSLDGGLELRHCPDLAVATAINHLGQRVALIGTVVEAEEDKQSPSSVLPGLAEGAVETASKTWTGHWILAVGDRLYGDCCGLFSVYLPRERLLQSAGEFVISNSPALISDFYGLGAATTDTRIMQPFAMAPWCFRSELRTLMAGEVLSLADGHRAPTEYPQLEVWDISSQEIRHRVARLITTGVRRLQEQSDQEILCALSGGYDSRLNLAAVSAAGLPFDAYTFVKSYFYITEADRLLPPKVAASIAANHKMVRAGVADRKRGEAYLKHAGGAVTTFPGSGYDHYIHCYWEQAGEGRFALDGQCYELSVNYHRKKFRPDFDATDVRAFGFGITDEDFSEVEAHWRHLQENSYRFDRRDLLFWSGNINGVYARMTQEHDLFTNLFFPACNREQMNLLLSVPIEEREGCAFQATVTASIRPELDRFPYNPPEPVQKRLLKRLRNEVLKRLPV